MAIPFTEGMVACGECARGANEPFTEQQLDQVNLGVSHMLGHEQSNTIEDMPLGTFTCASMITVGTCGRYKVAEYDFPPDITCQVDPYKMQQLIARNKAIYERNQRY